MDTQTLIRRIKRQFGDEYDVIITDDDIYGWIHEAELDIIRNAPDSVITSLNTAANVFPVAVPLKVQVQRIIYFTGSISSSALDAPLRYYTKEEIDNFGLGGTAYSSGQKPLGWFMENQQAYLFPSGSYSGQCTIQYTKVPVILTGPVEGVGALTVPEVYHTDVITYCLARAHNKNQNAQSEKMQMDLYDKSLSIRRNEADAIDQNMYKQIDPVDMEVDWSY